MNAFTTGKRNISLDLARILAATLVVLIHVVIIQWFTLDVSDPQWMILNTYNMASSAAVPMFFLISGNLFLGKHTMPDIKTLFGRYILKLCVIYLVWGLFYAMDTVGVRAVLSFEVRSILNTFLNTPKYHLWYLPAIVSVYLLLPFLWCIAHYGNGKYLGYACLLFFLWRIVGLLDAFTVQPPNFMLYLTYELSGYSGYFLLGHWLKQNPPKIRPRYLVAGYLLITLIGTACGILLSAREGSPNGLFLDYLGFFACIQTILLYCAFLQYRPHLSDRTANHITTLSKCTLFTYLVHPFVIEHLHDVYELLANALTPAAAVPLMTLLVQIICFAMALILLRIPLFKKLVV